jgi:ABC-type antimicrobial peptide transport system permease subunit
MLNFECALYAARSLGYGLAIGTAAALSIYLIFSQAEQYDFVFPWVNALISIIGVFAVSWITMRFSASRLRGGSVIDAIRGE